MQPTQSTEVRTTVLYVPLGSQVRGDVTPREVQPFRGLEEEGPLDVRGQARHDGAHIRVVQLPERRDVLAEHRLEELLERPRVLAIHPIPSHLQRNKEGNSKKTRSKPMVPQRNKGLGSRV